MTRRPIRFLHRGEIVSIHADTPTRTLLEALREDLNACGTKEGCAQGDCGACTVVVGEAKGQSMHYRAVNSCIKTVHSVDGMAVFTVEDLKSEGQLHPVQQSMVDKHASQCGFCTSGFVMSLYALYQNRTAKGEHFSRAEAQHAISGNLCRCTGYRPILDAAMSMQEAHPVHLDEKALIASLALLKQQSAAANQGEASWSAPATLKELLKTKSNHPDAQLIAGGTDVGVWITRNIRKIDQLIDLSRVHELQSIEHHPHHIAIGAAVNLTDAFAALASDRPHLQDFADRFASVQIRNAGTLGGNIANGSPIGDSMPLLIALCSNVVLMREQQGQIRHRELPLETLYTGYRQNVMRPDEVLAWIKVPKHRLGSFCRAYKVSKRLEDDISAVVLAIELRMDKGKVSHISIGAGGVAAMPARAVQTETFLQGKPWNCETAEVAAKVLQSEFHPISDMRASASYRSHILGALMQRFWLESQGQELPQLEALHPHQLQIEAGALTGPPHESAAAHVSGDAIYIDDIPEQRATLHAAPILSRVAHAKLLGIDTSEARNMPGVVDIVLASDIRGEPMLASFAHDEPIFAMDTLQHVGQVVGLVLAKSMQQARRAAKAVHIQFEALPAILDVRQALREESFVLPPVRVQRGNAHDALSKSAHVLKGTLEVGGQEHFYLEGQVAYAVPQEQNQWLIHSSTQHPGEVQHWVASALGVEAHAVQVQCRRMGGGFGGKETQSGHIAVWAAIAAGKCGHAVKLRLDRDDDFLVTGKRHPFTYDFEAGFDDKGRITALKIDMLVDCGFSADLSGPVADRAIFHSDNAYYLQDVDITSWRLKTNRQSHTAFRGFGGPQGMLVIEKIMGDIARKLDMDALDVRLANLYSEEPIKGSTEKRNTTHYQMRVEDNILLPLISKLEQSSSYRQRLRKIAAWNASSKVVKRGIALTPVKFGISFTATLFNQAGALVHVYTDGSVLVNHGGTEMGQGLHTKVLQIVATELGIPVDRVSCSASDTSKVPNASATAASAGTDLNGRAAQFAARNVRDNLAAFVCGLDGCGAGAIRFENGQVHSPLRTRRFEEVVGLAYANRIQLWSDGFYRTPKIHYDKTTLTGRPFYYFAYGAACTEVAIDTLTGENRVLRVDILHDVGRSINQALDVGQIEGGFVQGMGWLTTEELVWNDRGELTTHAPSTYKIPTAADVPHDMRVALWDEPNREDNVMGSKAVGEPPFMLAISVYEALRHAIGQARGQAGGQETGIAESVQLKAPATAENVLRSLGRI